jgi:hypothetical protein
MNFQVREQAKQGTTPIGPSPGVREIEAAIVRFGQALREIAHDVRPNLPGI